MQNRFRFKSRIARWWLIEPGCWELAGGGWRTVVSLCVPENSVCFSDDADDCADWKPESAACFILRQKSDSSYRKAYDHDSLVEDNLDLIKALTKVPALVALDGAPRGLRLALANHELYLDVPEKVVKDYKDALTEKILATGRELDSLNLRMSNPNYVERAPEHLVKETKDAIKEKEALISRLKNQLSLI